MSDYPMLISNKLHSFRNFSTQIYNNFCNYENCCIFVPAHESYEEQTNFLFTLHCIRCLPSV